MLEAHKWLVAFRQKGFLQTVKNWLIHSDMKVGTLVGSDHMGNKYYENKGEIVLGRDRWVEYGQFNMPKDPSSISPEWHAWMHRMTDIPPTAENSSEYYVPRPDYAWKEHRENPTGTDAAYRPYNTAASKYWSWNPASAPLKKTVQ